MLSPEVCILDINPYHWRHLFDTLFPRRNERRLVIVHERGRILKAFDTQKGLRPDLKSTDAHDPLGLAKKLHATEGAERVLVLERAALDDYFAALHTIYNSDEDGDRYFQRARLALDDDPRLVRYPAEPRGLHLAGISYEVWASLIAHVPHGHALVLGIFDEGRIWASLIVRVHAGKIGLITTSDAVMLLDVRVSDWRKDYRPLLEGVAAHIGPPFAGLFCTRAVFLDLVACDDKLARLEELRTKGDVILEPYPAGFLKPSMPSLG